MWIDWCVCLSPVSDYDQSADRVKTNKNRFRNGKYKLFLVWDHTKYTFFHLSLLSGTNQSNKNRKSIQFFFFFFTNMIFLIYQQQQIFVLSFINIHSFLTFYLFIFLWFSVFCRGCYDFIMIVILSWRVCLCAILSHCPRCVNKYTHHSLRLLFHSSSVSLILSRCMLFLFKYWWHLLGEMLNHVLLHAKYKMEFDLTSQKFENWQNENRKWIKKEKNRVIYIHTYHDGQMC